MNKLVKKYTIKIPENISVFYCDKFKIITFVGPLKQKTFKLKVQILLIQREKLIRVTRKSFLKMSSNRKKTLKVIQGTTVAILKQFILEVSVSLFNKLKFTGVGYKVFLMKNFENQLLNFKLGYSHQIYFKVPKEIKIYSLKSTNIFIFANSYQKLMKITALIRSYKKPEPYKGKGILYENEKIILKDGKKV